MGKRVMLPTSSPVLPPIPLTVAAKFSRAEVVGECAGKEKDVLRKDIGRNRFYNAQQAIDYGLIDRVVKPRGSTASMEKRNYEQMLVAAQAQQGRGRAAPAGVAADSY